MLHHRAVPELLAAAVCNARWRLVLLTMIFAAGVATVLVPVSLGVGLLTRSLPRYHGPVHLAGAALMLVLATVTATGKTWSLPILRRSPDVSRTDSGGVHALGVFSGAASACGAPVLAGVLALTAVASSTATGIGIGLAYVAGMVSLLLVMTLGSPPGEACFCLARLVSVVGPRRSARLPCRRRRDRGRCIGTGTRRGDRP